MKAYTGIGSRTITQDEAERIAIIAECMSQAGLTLYSGNAEGADRTFQEASSSKFVAFIPWPGFGPTEKNGTYVVTGSDPAGMASVDQFHPRPQALTQGGRKLMARNYNQVMGFQHLPKSEFVVCCADPADNKGNVKGGTGQAVRIALANGIPVFNIRKPEDIDRLKEFVKTLSID